MARENLLGPGVLRKKRSRCGGFDAGNELDRLVSGPENKLRGSNLFSVG